MKLVVSLIFFSLLLCLAGTVSAKEDKVSICHKTASEKNPWEAINIDVSAMQTHFQHGDFMYTGPTDKGKPTKDGDTWCGNNVPVVDACLNLDGVQPVIPAGYHYERDLCIANVATPSATATPTATLLPNTGGDSFSMNLWQWLGTVIILFGAGYLSGWLINRK